MNQNLRVVLIGPGDIEYYYFNLLKIPKEELDNHIEGIAKALKEADVELVLLPDRGISFEVAKKYKEFGGRKCYATVPLSDKDFGIKHLEQYINAEVNGKKIFDEIIDTQHWYKENLTHCLFGDLILMLGLSLGSLGEMCFGYYLNKLFVGHKPGVNTKKEKIHPEVRAGKIVPFSLIVYQPFLKGKLNYEIEQYITKQDAKIHYVKSPSEIKEILSDYKQKFIKRKNKLRIKKYIEKQKVKIRM